ncbi:MAG TPA: site-specific DNA-methyltransferase [Nannocystaceae bacterium]|nr:site-specific DNA-methyltransferase [Nannocystaceae bacterium]
MDGPADRMTREWFGLAFPGRAEAEAEAVRPPTVGIVADRGRSLRWDRARDVLVEGDNLDALKLLVPAYGGAVQTIYIDPPYNRGGDFVYRDDWSTGKGRGAKTREDAGRRHAPWLAMMLPRLQLAHALLRADGVVFVSIDDNEVHHLRLLLDEVFGRDNFIAQIVVVSNRGGRDYLRVAITHEYVVCYGRSPSARIRELPRPGDALPLVDGRGAYELRELRNRNPRFGPHNRPNLFYPIWFDPRITDAHGCHPVSLVAGRGLVAIEPRNKLGEGSVWRWGKPKLAAAIVAGDPDASEVVARGRRGGGTNVYEKHRKQTTKPRALWDDPAMRSEQGSIELRARLGAALFDHPKPIDLVRRCIEIGCDPDGLVLDFFAGSGTTLEAVHAQNRRDGGTRRCVLVQRPEPTPENSAARKAGLAHVAEIARMRIVAALASAGDAGLRVFRCVDPPPRGAAARWSSALASGVRLDGDPAKR